MCELILINTCLFMSTAFGQYWECAQGFEKIFGNKVHLKIIFICYIKKILFAREGCYDAVVLFGASMNYMALLSVISYNHF